MIAVNAEKPEGVEVLEQQPSRQARLALWVSALGFGVEGFDLLLLVLLLAPISATFGLTPMKAGSLMTGTLFGAVLGGIFFGLLSDYLGRVRVLRWTIVFFGVFTGLCALAGSYRQLLIFRGIAGLGFGGEFGIGLALVAETWPAHLRARASSYIALGGQAGILVATLLTPILLYRVGWRGMFLVGVVPTLFTVGIRRFLREPESFVRVQRRGHAEFPIRVLFKDRRTSRTSLGVIVLCCVQQIGYYGLMTWLPFYLTTRHGLTLTKSSLWTAVTVLGMSSGIWVFGQLADRVGRRPAFLLFQGCAAIAVLVYSQLHDGLPLLIGGAIMGIFVNGMLGGYGALISELYPTEARATAQNLFFNIGRAVGGFGPLIIGGLAAKFSFPIAIGLLALLYVIDMFATTFLIPETKGVSLA